MVGNRPQFIKSAPLSLALGGAGIDEVVVHTGQHYDRELSQVFFDELDLAEPSYRLEARTSEPAAMEPGIDAAIARERPDWVVVYGDTNTTLAGAHSAARAGVPVAHVEAGLRSGDVSMPEERNRIAVDRIAELLLAPDERSRQTLAGEGVAGRIEVVGDVMYDATLTLAPIARERSRVLERLRAPAGEYTLMTIHREANVQPDRLGAIMSDVNGSGCGVWFPAHPRTRAVIEREGIEIAPTVALVEPLGYLDFTALASQAAVIVTDSGGLQKEAYWYGIPCITVRPSTEWVDTVAVGANVLVEPGGITAALAHPPIARERPQLYGDGHASERIAATLLGSLGAA